MPGARALGLGTTPKILYLIHKKVAEAAMGIPDTHHSYANLVPAGELWSCASIATF
jgi:hypothetical protein